MTATTHQYVGILNLNLNSSQKLSLFNELRALGPSASPSPAMLLQERLRLDDEGAIYEALFDESKLSIQQFINWLASIFGAQPESISSSTIIQSFAGGTTPVTTFTYNTINYIRSALFGGMGCGWHASGRECRGYLSLYQNEWENEV